MSAVRGKPGWSFWAALVAGCLALYLAGFGPLCRLHRAGPGRIRPASTLTVPYSPVFWVMEHGPPPVKSALIDYISWWLA